MTATFYVGDVLDVLSKLPENSVDLVLSSPPFLSLRSYLPSDHPDKHLEGGSQATPGEYIDWLLDVVEACDRVLAPHGSICLELGDTYSGASGWESAGPDLWSRGGEGIAVKEWRARSVKTFGIGWPLPKSLSLIPESFRFAMVYGFNPFTGRQTDRWRLRNVIRWVRPNPPVGALGDKFRPATSELMVFCKSAKRYFDLDAVREPYTGGTLQRGSATRPEGGKATSEERGGGWSTLGPFNHKTLDVNHGAPPLDWWNIPLLEGEEPTKYGPKELAPKWKPGDSRDWPKSDTDVEFMGKRLGPRSEHPMGSPPLDWWQISPGGYEGSHYAVFPAELCIKPIKAMCPEQVCRTCGEARRRIVEKSERYEEARATLSVRAGTGWDQASGNRAAGLPSNAMRARLSDGSEFTAAEYTTTGFTDCGHDNWRTGVVLDCFGGSGTTAAVATGHGRDCVLIDLDERNFDLALERVGPLVLHRGEVAA